MTVAKDYLQEVQKFTSSQYWYSGLRITGGVILPLLLFIWKGWLGVAVPFLWGALFVSLTDTPGPVHHRRNGMIAAVVLNTALSLLTAVTKEYQALLITQIVIFGFLLTMLSVYGGRAAAVGSLALILMLLNLLSFHDEYNTLQSSFLIAAGGCWYMFFSLLLHGIRPYRSAEQALGEHLIVIADYIRARASFYREGSDLRTCFHRVMTEQSRVREIQTHTQELLFKTRKIVADASPRSRSLMMIYLDSVDLFEQSMYSYQDYEDLHKSLANTGLLDRFYGLILELAAGLEYIGLCVQMGKPVSKHFDVTRRLAEVRQTTDSWIKKEGDEAVVAVAEALSKVIRNIQEISNRMNRLILYTRMEVDVSDTFDWAQRVSRRAATQPMTFKVLRENLTFKSDIFRHAIRLTLAMIAGYLVSGALQLGHSYWVLLTTVTILRPAYVLTRKRNVERVAGTLVGGLLVIAIMWTITNTTVLLGILMVSMLVGFSMLRVHYFTFVVFLTIFVIISLYFLNPTQFQSLIRERLVDTIVGSGIAFVASRFIFPVWGHQEIRPLMQKMLEANRQYFLQAWMVVKSKGTETPAFALARRDAIVSLTNLSEGFQRMLAEPQQPVEATPIHQFVIANHMLTGYIAALSEERLPVHVAGEELDEMASAILFELQCAEDNLRHNRSASGLDSLPQAPLSIQSLTQLSMIYALARDIRKITAKVGSREFHVADRRLA